MAVVGVLFLVLPGHSGCFAAQQPIAAARVAARRGCFGWPLQLLRLPWLVVGALLLPGARLINRRPCCTRF
jgi:hypothetical protein